MKICIGCIYADWQKTKSGKLHPSGGGWCKYDYKIPELPASRHWMGIKEPVPCGGYIERKQETTKICIYRKETDVKA